MKNIYGLLIVLSVSFSSHANKDITLSAPTGAVIQDVSVLILEEAYREIGYDVKVERFPNERALIYANNGKTDGDVSRIKGLNKKYENLVRVPVAINFLEAYAFMKPGSPVINDWPEFEGHRVVCVRGIKFVEKILRDNSLSCTVVGRFNQALKLISMGRMDATIFPKMVGVNAIRKFGVEDVVPIGKPLKTIPLFHYVNIKNTGLVPELTAVLEKMKGNNRFSEIRSQYVKENNY